MDTQQTCERIQTREVFNLLREIYPVEHISLHSIHDRAGFVVRISDGVRIYSAKEGTFLGCFKDQKTALTYFKSFKRGLAN